MPKFIERRYSSAGGLNYLDNPVSLLEDELSDCRNIRVDSTGAAFTRKGFTALTTSAAGDIVTSLCRFYKEDGTTRYTVAFANQTMRQISGGTFSPISTTVFTADSNFTFATFDNNLYWGNGVEAPEKWSGTGNSSAAPGSPPTWKYVTGSLTARRLFAVPDKSYRLFYPAIGNADDWTTANDAGFIDVETDDGEPIQGIREVRGALVIWKKSSIHVLTGSDPQTFQLRQISSEVGCTAPRSIGCNYHNCFFFHQDRFYETDGTNIFPISERLVPVIQSSVSDTAVLEGVVFKDEYRCFFPTSGSTNSQAFVYQFNIRNKRGRGAWVRDDNMAAASTTVFHGEAGELYFGAYNGHVYQLNSGTTDAGTGIPWRIDTADIFYGEPERKKKSKRLYVLVEPTGAYNLTVNAAYNGGDFGTPKTVDLSPSAAIWDSASFAFDSATTAFDGGEAHIRRRLTFARNCYSAMFRFTASSPGKVFGLSHIIRKKFIR